MPRPPHQPGDEPALADLPHELATLAAALGDAIARHALARVREDLARGQTPEPWLTPDQAARHAGVGVSTVLEWIRSGRLPHGRAGAKLVRVRASDVDAFLRAGAEADEPEARASAVLESLRQRPQRR